MQLITGPIGMFCLYILGNAFITGGEGLLFVSPTSGIMSEIFLQNMENEHFHKITKKKT